MTPSSSFTPPAAGASWAPLVKRFLLAAAALFLVFLLVRRISSQGFDVHLLWTWLRRAHLGWLALSWALVLGTYYWRALRWNVMLKPLNPNVSTSTLYAFTAIGFTAVLLFSRAGEIVRPYLIARHAKVAFASQMAAWVLERMYDLLCVLILFGFALGAISTSGVQVGDSLRPILRAAGALGGSAAVGCLLLLLAFQVWAGRIADLVKPFLLRLPRWLSTRAVSLMEHGVALSEGARSLRATSYLLAFSALHWMNVLLCLQAVFLAFPETAALSFGSVVVYLGFTAFGGILQIPGVGGGYQIVSILVLNGMFGIGIEAATGFALVSWLTTFLVVAPLGLLLSARYGVHLVQVKKFSSEVRA